MKIFQRGFMALGIAAALASSASFAQLPPPDGGPIVWPPYTQNQLDATYDQNFWDNDPPETGTRSAANGDVVRALYGEPTRVAYGPSSFEMLDIHSSSSARGNSPIMIFIHGGAWRGGSARGAAANAEMFMQAGAHYIALDFVNALQNGGNLMEMAEQVRRAVAWVYNNAHTFDGDRRRIFISGHSSGGHLCGVAMTTDWRKFGLPRNVLKGGVCISGMYDLVPVSLSARRTYVNFTRETVQELSPIRHLDQLVSPIVVGYGTKESPEFMRQSADFAKIVASTGKPVTLIVGPGYNHFEWPETLGNPYGLLGRAALELMGLVPNGAKGPK